MSAAVTPLLPRAVEAPTQRPARRLLSFGQVRRRLGVSRVTLWGWIAEGKFPRHTHELPEIKSQTQRRRWDVAAVDEWTEARRLRD